MPLVIICGYPSSGKTTLSLKLKNFLDSKLAVDARDFNGTSIKSVQLVNEEFLQLPSNDYFMNVNEEKKVRAALLAASERFVSKDTILILDSLNYIKGFRYQLYCQARAAATSHLVIHCQAREDTCRYWNGLKSARAYPSDQLEDLILRFEAPNNQTKWDSPLFGIVTEGSTDQELSNLFHSLLPVITSSPNRPPSTATLTTKPTSSNSIQILDHETQAIIDTIIKHQQDQLPLVKFSQTAKTLALPRPVSVATLSRVRRQFLHLNRLHPTTDPEKIRSLFIDFLAANIAVSDERQSPATSPMTADLLSLIDPIFIAYGALTLMALLPIYFGSFSALEEIKKEESEKMSQSDAYMFPVIGSVFLFSFYLLFKFFSKEYINLLLTAYFGVFGTISLAGMLGTMLHALLPEQLAMKEARSVNLIKLSDKKVEYSLEITWPRIIAFLLAAAFTLHYSLTKNWISSNLLGLSFAFTAIKVLHLDSFKTGMILLAGLFLYDIFWVFGTDVMVSVAKSFDVPVKLLFPRNIISGVAKEFTMLGLGDIVIPGVMVSLCLRFDRHLTPESTTSYSKYYFNACFLAYLLGLTTTMAVMHTFKAAQPALLYLSPACIMAPLIVATCRRQIGQLFAYSTEEAKTEIVDKED